MILKVGHLTVVEVDKFLDGEADEYVLDNTNSKQKVMELN